MVLEQFADARWEPSGGLEAIDRKLLLFRCFASSVDAETVRARIILTGDAAWCVNPLRGNTKNLSMVKPPEERISYMFDGNSQSLDHVVASLGANQSATLTTLHVNSVPT